MKKESGTTVLIIEDELPIRKFVRATLGAQGFSFLEASTGSEGTSLAASHHPDIILLDLGLPDTDGLSLIKALRTWTAIPILVISARGKEQDKVTALDAGADDYLTKPFGVGELMARLRVALRHSRLTKKEQEAPTFDLGGLRMDFSKHQVYVDKREIHLTPTEYRLLSVMIRHAGKVVTQRQLLMEIWGPGHESQTHYLRIYIHELRQKLEPDPARPRFLITEAGVGYRFKED